MYSTPAACACTSQHSCAAASGLGHVQQHKSTAAVLQHCANMFKQLSAVQHVQLALQVRISCNCSSCRTAVHVAEQLQQMSTSAQHAQHSCCSMYNLQQLRAAALTCSCSYNMWISMPKQY